MNISSPNQAQPSLADQLRQLRTDTQNLADKSGGVTSEFGTLQQTAYDSYNQCHAVYENAYDASTDDGDTDNSANGVAMNAALPGLNTNQQTLLTSSTKVDTDTSFCQTELMRVGTQLTALAASAPQGPAAAALQQAINQLGQAYDKQGEVQFDDSAALAQTQSLITSVTAEAAAIAADVPGSNVTLSARGAMNDLESAQTYYEQVGRAAEQNGFQQVPVGQYCQDAVASLDQAIAILAPEPDNRT